MGHSQEDIARIVEICLKNVIYIISDEATKIFQCGKHSYYPGRISCETSMEKNKEDLYRIESYLDSAK